MQTYSHVALTAALGRWLARRRITVSFRSFWLGALLPDLPLYLLTAGYWTWRVLGDPFAPDEGVFGPRYDRLYLGNPVWVALHNLFHAPLLLALYAAGGWLALRRGVAWAPAVLWLVGGAALHTLADVATHHHDGPLLLFPVDWSFRFTSPISYWDPRYHARIVSAVEHVLDLAAILYLFATRRRRTALERRPGTT